MTRLYIHIGLQKTGTSYLQNVCWGSVEQLRKHGVTMVPDSRVEAFWLALDVRRRIDPADSERVRKSVDLLPEQLTAVKTPAALITQETLGSASSDQIQRLIDACAGHEVHVIITARDLGRQVPSLWQENLKAGRTQTLDEFAATLRSADGQRGLAWRRLDLAGVVRRWVRVVPPERIHVVTVPGPAGPRTALLDRYCSVLDVPADALDLQQARAGNPGLGAAEAELLRRVNAGLPERLRRRVPYGAVGKRWFAMLILTKPGAQPLRLGRDHSSWCQGIAGESIEAIESLGCSVSGDLDDLVPEDGVFEDSEGPTEPEVLAAATAALTQVLESRLEDRLEERHSSKQRLAVQGGRLARVLHRLGRRRT